jgi:hypothetical protein
MTFAAASDTSAVYFSGRSYHSTAAAMAGSTPGGGTVAAFNKGDSPSFSDLLDIVNPLQHIPIVNTIYRQLTGDKESAAADIIGGALYGGPIGMASAIVDLGLHDATGKSAGDNMVALLTGNPDAKDTMTAAADPKTGATTTPAATAAAAMAAPPAKMLTSSIAGATAPAAAPVKTAASAARPAASASSPSAAPAAPVVAAASPVLLTPASPVPAAAPAAMAPRAAVTSSAIFPAKDGQAKDGPVADGNYLVFGADAAPAASAAPAAMRQAPATAKDFAVFGGNAAPGKTLPATDDQTVASAAPALPAAAAAPLRQRIFPVPPRNGPAVPTAVLPPPTTGPGALPGGKSQALSAQDLAVAQDPQHNFLTAYTQALDKYRHAQQLAASPIQPATSIVTGKPDPAPEAATDEGAMPEPAAATVH